MNFSELEMQQKALDRVVTQLLKLPLPCLPGSFMAGDIGLLTGCTLAEAESCLMRLSHAGVVEWFAESSPTTKYNVYVRTRYMKPEQVPVNRVTHLMVNTPRTPEWNLMYSDDCELIGLRFALADQNTFLLGKEVVALAAAAPLGVELEHNGVRFFGVSVLQATVRPLRDPQ